MPTSGYSIAVDSSGNIAVTGNSTVTWGSPLRAHYGGGSTDAFVVKLGVPQISGNAGTGGVTLSYDDGGAKTATAESSGNYSFSVSDGWSGTVTPLLAGYTFTRLIALIAM